MAGIKDLTVDIFSNFKEAGFRDAESSMDSLKGVSQELGLSTRELNKRMEALSLNFEDGEFMPEGSEEPIDTANAINALSQEFAALGAMSQTIDKDLDIVQNRLDATETGLAKNSEGAAVFRNEFTGTMDESSAAAAKVSNQLDTFNQEALSALFATLAVGDQMSDLVEPAFDAAGVFDLISNTLKIFFLPVAMEVRDLVLKIRDRLLDTDKSTKKWIGRLVVVVGVLAKVGSAVAGFILNLGGIKTILIKAGALLAKFGGALKFLAGLALKAGSAILGALSATVLFAIAILIAAIVGLKIMWDKNLGGIRQKVGRFVKWIGNNFPMVVRAISPVIGAIDLLIMAVNRLFGKDIETLGAKFESVGDGIANMGDDMIESGNKFDEMNKKAPDAKELQKDMTPDMPGSKVSTAGKRGAGARKQTIQNNKFDIQTKEGQSERKVAKEVTKMQKRNKDNTTREP